MGVPISTRFAGGQRVFIVGRLFFFLAQVTRNGGVYLMRITDNFPFPHVISCSDAPDHTGKYRAVVSLLNPVTGHMLRYRDVDQVMHTLSPHPNVVVRSTVHQDTAEKAIESAAKKVPILADKVRAYLQLVLPYLPHPLCAESLFVLMEKDVAVNLAGAERTQQKKMRDIRHIILPLMDGIDVNHMTSADYRKIVQAIKRRPCSAARKNELLHLLREYTLILYRCGCCCYAPDILDASVSVSRTEKEAAYCAKMSSEITLSDSDIALLQKGAEKEPPSSLAPLIFYLIYDGLSPADISLLRMRHLHVAHLDNQLQITVSVPDTGNIKQPVSRIREVPLSFQSIRLIASRIRYWQQYGIQNRDELLDLPLVSSRRRNPQFLRVDDIYAHISDFMAKYLSVPPRLANGAIHTHLLEQDAAYRIRYRIGADTEQCAAILGTTQHTTDGRHYYDIFSDISMHTIAAKKNRDLLFPPSHATAGSLDQTGITQYITAAATSSTYHIDIPLPAGALVTVNSSIGAHCCAHMSYP